MSGAPFARPVWDINHVLSYGQSYSTGWDGWPPLSTRPHHDNLMLGASVRPISESAPRWIPHGLLVMRPLCATAQHAGGGGLLPPGECPGGPLLGETILEGALAYWRARQHAENALSGRLLASACGVGGRTLEQLSRGAQPELFNRLRDCVRFARLACAAERLSYGLCAVLLLQGESNLVGQGVRDHNGYKVLLHRLIDDIAQDVAADVAGQREPPAVFLYQTRGAYVEDDMGVPQAQLDVALERPGVFMAAPAYPYPEARGHLDANGYRWLGAQFGKAMHRVLTQGTVWRPLHPLRAMLDGDSVRVAFHVPHPPLAWGRPFVGKRRRDIPDRGFTVLDAAGAIPLRAVVLEGAEAVRLDLARRPMPAGPLLLRYADRTAHSGHGCLHDSDSAVAEDPFVADYPGADYAEADVAELGGRPYALVNWCAAFTIAVAR